MDAPMAGLLAQMSAELRVAQMVRWWADSSAPSLAVQWVGTMVHWWADLTAELLGVLTAALLAMQLAVR